MHFVYFSYSHRIMLYDYFIDFYFKCNTYFDNYVLSRSHQPPYQSLAQEIILFTLWSYAIMVRHYTHYFGNHAQRQMSILSAIFWLPYCDI